MNSRRSHFSAPWGASVRIVSVVIVVAILAGGAAAAVAPKLSSLARTMITSGALLVLALAATTTVRGYCIANDVLVIERLGWKTKVSLAGLCGASADPKALRWSLRLWGHSGLFGVSGRFWNKTLGRYRAYVTDVQRSVVLRFPRSAVVISPDSPSEFIAQLKERGLLQE
jgi:hypothetical protein